jgi:hypothetical protein
MERRLASECVYTGETFCFVAESLSEVLEILTCDCSTLQDYSINIFLDNEHQLWKLKFLGMK